MDVPLYAIALVVFSILYLAIGVFLAFVIVITLIVMLLYITLRHGKLPENYPHGTSDIMITVIFIGVTWGIFTYLGPKNPIPFLPMAGHPSLTYSTGQISLLPYISISLILIVFFLIVGAFVGRDLRTAFGGGGGANQTPSDGNSKPKQGVGA